MGEHNRAARAHADSADLGVVTRGDHALGRGQRPGEVGVHEVIPSLAESWALVGSVRCESSAKTITGLNFFPLLRRRTSWLAHSHCTNRHRTL